MCTKEYKQNEDFNNESLGFSINLSAPGKVILFGEHSVVYGKPALASSLGLRTYLNLAENFNDACNKIVLNFEAVKLHHCYEIVDVKQELFSTIESKTVLQKPELIHHEEVLEKVEAFIMKRGGNIPLQKSQHQSVVAFFYLLATMLNGLDLHPFTITIKSDLDIGAGLGSSASFLVVISAALYEYYKYKTEKLSVEDINEFSFCNLEFNRKKTFSQIDLDLISKWAFNAEQIIHGNPSGLDNTICTYGGMVEFKKMSPISSLGLKHKLSVILVNSKVPRNTKVMVMRAAALKDKYPKVIGHILDAMEEVTLQALTSLRSLDETIKSKEGVEKCLEDCVDINQNLLCSLGVSHTTLDEICAVLLERNLHGKLTGAGGGGYAFAFISDSCSKSDLSTALENLGKRGYSARVVELGGPGVMHC